MPTTLLCSGVYWLISGSRRRRQLDSRKKMVRALAELDRFLNRNDAVKHRHLGIRKRWSSAAPFETASIAGTQRPARHGAGCRIKWSCTTHDAAGDSMAGHGWFWSCRFR
eukprot:symbB.v1.2.038291.t1/scaffold5914.1/size22488/1